MKGYGSKDVISKVHITFCHVRAYAFNMATQQRGAKKGHYVLPVRGRKDKGIKKAKICGHA